MFASLYRSPSENIDYWIPFDNFEIPVDKLTGNNFVRLVVIVDLNPLSANPTKWSDTLK